MRKHLLPLSLLLLLAGCAVIQKRISDILHPEQPVSKSISFAVNTDENYSSIVYNDAFAQLRITVTKIRGNQRAMVWDTIYNPQKLQDYSFLKNAMSKEIIINNVLE